VPSEKSEPPVGSEEPRKPEYSLPRYDEPTPETHRKLSREEEAELALKHTKFTPGARGLLIALFLITLAAVPVIQLVVETRSSRAGGALPTFNVYKTLPSWVKILAAHSPRDFWHLLPRAVDLKAAEKSLESGSVVSQWLLPRVQSLLTGTFHAGNEQVYPGRDGALFYRPDVDFITGPPFLAARQLHNRSVLQGTQPDPVKAIVNFRDQLAARGIDFIALPVPVKPSIDGEMLSPRAGAGHPLENASFAEFKARLEKAGVRIFDPTNALMERKAAGNGAPLYLESDTHWRPDTMEFVAERLAALINPPDKTTGSIQITDQEITGFGDIEKMLLLPASQKIYRPETVHIRQIAIGNELWRASKDGDILLLGDSFANIFSLSALGWGEAAGLAEHLSRALGGRPLDCILRNSDAAFATREILSHELARGRDRLAGKKLVVWEFAARELAFGDWKLLDLKLGTPPPAHFFVPKTGQEIVASGTVEAISNLVRPGTAPYRDHILALHLVDLSAGGNPPAEALVYVWSMRDNVLTPAARLRAGDRITLRLRAWSDVAPELEKINRSEIDDPAVQLEEPCWGELAN